MSEEDFKSEGQRETPNSPSNGYFFGQESKSQEKPRNKARFQAMDERRREMALRKEIEMQEYMEYEQQMVE